MTLTTLAFLAPPPRPANADHGLDAPARRALARSLGSPLRCSPTRVTTAWPPATPLPPARRSHPKRPPDRASPLDCARHPRPAPRFPWRQRARRRSVARGVPGDRRDGPRAPSVLRSGAGDDVPRARYGPRRQALVGRSGGRGVALLDAGVLETTRITADGSPCARASNRQARARTMPSSSARPSRAATRSNTSSSTVSSWIASRRAITTWG